MPNKKGYKEFSYEELKAHLGQGGWTEEDELYWLVHIVCVLGSNDYIHDRILEIVKKEGGQNGRL